MGYITHYILSFECLAANSCTHNKFMDECKRAGIDIPVEIIKPTSLYDAVISTLKDDSLFSYRLYDCLGCGEELKWYQHEDAMKALSVIYPTVLFTLEGRGEDSEDVWVKYFKGGKMQRVEAKITFEPFDEEKLV